MKDGLYAGRRPVVLTAPELCTSLGLTAETTFAEIGAGTLRFVETEVKDPAGEGVRAGRSVLVDETVGPSATRTERMSVLAATALQAHLQRLEGLPLVGVSSLPVILALGDGPGVEVDRILRDLRSVAGAEAPERRLTFDSQDIIRQGRAGAFVALASALHRLESGALRAVVVGAADSACDPDSLKRLAQANRMLGSRNSDGRLVSEGAGFVLLTRADVRLGLVDGGLQLDGVALHTEKNGFEQAAPNLGDGLTRAFREFRRHPTFGPRRVDLLISGQSSERIWGEELTTAYLRNESLMPEPFTPLNATASLGDLGAAAGMCQLQCALEAPLVASGSRTPPTILLYSCADAGRVGAALVHRPVGRRRPPRTPSVAASPKPQPLVRLLSKSTARMAFAQELIEEHTDEIGFLLDYRQTGYLNDPVLGWQDAEDPEDRILRHLHALRAWGPDAVTWLSETGLQSEGEDTLRGAVYALASLTDLSAQTPALYARIEAVDEDLRAVIAEGLRQADQSVVSTIGDVVVPLLAWEQPAAQRFAADLMSAHRAGAPRRLAALLKHADSAAPEVLDAAARALAQFGDRTAQHMVAWVADRHRTPGLIESALRLGHEPALEWARDAVSGAEAVDPEMYTVLALAGTAEDADRIIRAWPQDPEARCSACIALGILGTPASLAKLRLTLEDPDDVVRVHAGQALVRVTGVFLKEHAVVSEDPDDPAEETVERVSTDVAGWDRVLRRFRKPGASGRIRRGAPFHDEACLQEAQDNVPGWAHRWALREWSVRTQRPLFVPVDAFVQRQRIAWAHVMPSAKQ